MLSNRRRQRALERDRAPHNGQDGVKVGCGGNGGSGKVVTGAGRVTQPDQTGYWPGGQVAGRTGRVGSGRGGGVGWGGRVADGFADTALAGVGGAGEVWAGVGEGESAEGVAGAGDSADGVGDAGSADGAPAGADGDVAGTAGAAP